MGRRDDNLQHYGPEPHFGSGAEMTHHSVHERAIGKTIAAVYLGDSERFPSQDPANSPPDGIYRSEYLTFEFTDGTVLELLIGSGNSFAVGDGEELARAKRAHGAATKRLPAHGHIAAEIPEHASEGQALTEASQTDGSRRRRIFVVSITPEI